MSKDESGAGPLGRISLGLSDLFNVLAELDDSKLPTRGRREKDGMVIEYSFGKRTLADRAGERDADEASDTAEQTSAQPKPARRRARPSELEMLEPVTDIFDEPDEILLLFELPGVGERDIRCLLDGDILLLEAKAEGRLYRKEVLIETPLRPGAPKRRLQNGVLEVRLQKAP